MTAEQKHLYDSVRDVTIQDVLNHVHIGHGNLEMKESEDTTRILVWCTNTHCEWWFGRDLIEE